MAANIPPCLLLCPSGNGTHLPIQRQVAHPHPLSLCFGQQHTNKTAITWNLEPRPQVTLQHLSWPQCNAALSPPWTKAPLLTAGTNARHVIKATETPAQPILQFTVATWLGRGSLRVEPPANPSSNCLPTGLWANTHCCNSKLLCFTVLCFQIVTKLTQHSSLPGYGWSGNDIPKGKVCWAAKEPVLVPRPESSTHRQRRHSRLVTGAFPDPKSGSLSLPLSLNVFDYQDNFTYYWSI